jgi:hypothetical protein
MEIFQELYHSRSDCPGCPVHKHFLPGLEVNFFYKIVGVVGAFDTGGSLFIGYMPAGMVVRALFSARAMYSA